MTWTVLGKPVAFFYASEPGCASDSCVQTVLALGNPLVWWGSTLAIGWAVWLLLARKDWRAGAALVGLAAGWLPWFYYSYHSDRTVFQLYSVVFLPFLIIALVLLLGSVLGPSDADPGRRGVGAAVVGGYLVVVIVLTAMFWPVLTAAPITHEEWSNLMWFRSWI